MPECNLNSAEGACLTDRGVTVLTACRAVLHMGTQPGPAHAGNLVEHHIGILLTHHLQLAREV